MSSTEKKGWVSPYLATGALWGPSGHSMAGCPVVKVSLMATRRQRRVAELVHRELGLLLMREVRDPRLADVTITEVRMTPDLLIARVYFTVLGGDEEARDALTALERANGFLRSSLANRVRLRSAPELAFELDNSAAYAQRIDELLAQVAELEGFDDGSEASE